jgi:hypothetical protein
MLATAQYLSDRALWQKSDEGANKPAQNGLAYSYGGKDPDIRQKPPAGCCTEQVYGLDCSGFVHQAATSAGLPIPVGPASLQGTPEPWNEALVDGLKLVMKTVDLTQTGYESGDIIGWGSHIGIVVVDAAAGVSVFQSNGVSGCKPEGGKDADQCSRNRGPTRGPRRIALADALQWFGAPSSVLRLVPEASFTVKLDWGGQPDVDLHVVEPGGAHVYFGNRQGGDGFLDLDDTSQFGPEHYFVRQLTDGDYRVGVAYFSGGGPETARVTITAGSRTHVFTQALTVETGTSAIPVATVRVSTDPGSGERKIEVLATGSSARGARLPAVPNPGKPSPAR